MATTERKARAETGLLESLAKPRVFHNKSGYGKGQSSTSALLSPEVSDDLEGLPSSEDGGGDPFSTTKVDLALAASQRKALRIREQQKEIEEVAILRSDPMKEFVPHKFTKLEKKMDEKRARHDRAYKDYRMQLRALSDDIELLYVKEADSIKENLVATDKEIQVIFDELNKDEILEMQSLAYVEGMWDKINALLSRRTSEVVQFADNLESFERTRSDTLSSYLRSMVDEMVNTALKLPQEIERVAEVEAFELNSVITGNRRAHAELMARMEKEDIMEQVTAREKWEHRMSDWRQLRHDRGIREFHRDITADNFMNPPDRVSVFEAFKAAQKVRHDERCEILKKLGDMRNKTLASEKVNDIRQEFNKMNKVEVEAIKSLYDQLTALKHAKHDEAEKRREDLRHELHNYGALHLEPDVGYFAGEIDAVVNSAELEEFLRKSGGLKPELVKISKQLRDPNLIYLKLLDAAVESLTVVQCGKDLEIVLEKQGKSSLRKTAQDTLERLRKATKSEVLPILPVLKQQCTALALVNGIDPLLKKELALAADGLQELVTTAEHSKQDNENLNSTSKSRANTAATGEDLNNTAATGADPAASSRAPSEAAKSNRSNRSSRRRSVSVAGGGGAKAWEDSVEIDMLQVRAIQKKVGLLLACCDLSDEFKEVLAQALLGMADKRVCNERIDEAVRNECSGPIEQRDYEQESLIDWAEATLSTQSQVLEKGAERICSFYHGVSLSLEHHRRKEIDIDDVAAETMFNLKEDFRLDNDVREGNVSHALDRLRHAADEKELELNFAKALRLLDLIESEYRVYHTTATHAADKHPVAAEDEHRHFTFMLCKKFGLVPPQDMVFPTESLEEVEEKKKEKKNATIAPVAEEGKEGSEEEKKEGGTAGSDEKDHDDSAPADGEENDPADDEFYEEGDEDLPEEELAEKRARQADEKAAKQRESELEAQREAERLAAEPKTAAELWGDDIVDGFKTTGVGHYDYGVKCSVEYMTDQFLAPPPKDAADEEVPPEQFVLLTRTVKTAEELEKEEEERLAAEQAALEEAAKAAKAAKKGGKKKAEVVEVEEEEEEDPNKEPDFFDPEFTRRTEEEVLEMNEEEEEIDKLSDESYAIYSGALEEINVRRAIKKRIMLEAKEKLNSTPQDKDGNYCVEITALPSETVISYVCAIRESLISVMEEESQNRRKVTDDLCEERKEDLTEELEERLRLHWPRKGRTEVKFRQPREGELISHRQKSARFLRQFYKRMSDQEENFAALVQEVNEHADEFVSNVESLGSTLKDQGSLAALQGLEMKCKKLLSMFRPECEDYLEMLNLFVSQEPSKLASTISELLRLTKTFQNGGDYDQKEVDDLKELLVEPREKLDAAVEARREKIEAAMAYEEASMKSTKAFKKEYDKCLQELSLREGLGKKYGAPRRNAQERLRTEVTRDEFSANQVDALLEKLEKLCEAVRDAKEVRFKGEEDAESSLPLGVRLKHVTLSLRCYIYRRAEYLEFIKGDNAKIGAKDEIPMDIEETISNAVWQEEEPMVVGTFESAIKTLQEQCKEETYALYSAEGKTDLLGETGVPESLAKWLHNNNIKVLGPEDGEILNEGKIVCMDGKDTYTVKYVGGLEEKKVDAVLIREYGTQPVRAPEPPVWREGQRVEVHFQCHREKARRRLRTQISRLEKIIAKTPVPPNAGWLGAPSASMKDATRRSALKSESVRETAEEGFGKLLKVWEGVRKKHVLALRPQLGSVDAKDQLDKLVGRELKRGEEITAAVAKFKQSLLETEAKSAKESVERLRSVLHGWKEILDKMVLRDDLLSLPGDELILPKRKSLKRLRKSSVISRKNAGGGEEEDGAGGAEEGGGGKGPGGRHWPEREWNFFDLKTLSDEMQKDLPPPKELSEEEKEELEKEKEKAKKAKGKAKAKAKAPVEEEEEEEGEENSVEKWEKEAVEAGKFTSYVTTAHRCLVKTTTQELKVTSDFFAKSAKSIREKYEAIEKRENVWREKWLGLVEDLRANGGGEEVEE
ncbi:hypothetical protein TrRE_jg12660 [Triparma retinervis]|uniref:Uncharacterized protein n=1 Tax=Triparma retinervis TaxID=2557542 RepID=A0A9W7C6B1_9STRA|nr:hypothetical protein TrRE_jg12660 [Triparma retinervis]